MNKELSDRDALHAEFTAQFDACAAWLYSYILSLIRQPDDATEVLQETAVVLWQKFDQWHRATEFRAWACRVAYFKALKHRDKSQRRPTSFSDAFYESVTDEVVVMADRLDARMVALNACLEKLPATDQKLVQQRYAAGGDVKQLAIKMACSTHSIYRSLARIHDALFECVNRKMA